MARSQIHLGQITLANTQTAAGIIPIDTNMQGIAIDGASQVAGQFNVETVAGMNLSNITTGNVAITNSSTGLLKLTDGINNYLEFDATTGVTELMNITGGIKIVGTAAQTLIENKSGGLKIDTSTSASATWDMGTGGIVIADGGVGGSGFTVNMTGGGGGINLKANGAGGGFIIESNIAGTGGPLSITSGAGVSITNNIGGSIIVSQNFAAPIQISANVTSSTIDIDSNAGITIDNNVSGNIVITNAGGIAAQINILNSSSTDNSGNSIKIQASLGSVTMYSENGMYISNLGSAGNMFISNSATTDYIKYSAAKNWILSNKAVSDAVDIDADAGGIDIDATTGITINNSTSGNIVITNTGGNITLTPKDANPVILEKSQVRTTKSILVGDTPYTAANELYILANPVGGNIVVNLPAVSGNNGLIYKIKNSDITLTGNTVTVDASTTETIDGNLTIVLNDLEAIEIVCDGVSWYIV